MKEGDKVIALNNQPLGANTIAPLLIVGKEYEIKRVIQDKAGNDHFDVGLKSNYNFIRSFETGEELPESDQIHWCHPSRFALS